MIPKDKVKGKKFAIYIRRSEGESGSTANQLTRIKKQIDALEKATGRKINRSIVGKDIKGKRRFNARTDLVLPGDIYNEGEGASGFKTVERPVFMKLVEKLQNGEYDGVAVESFDRISRDILGLAHLALPLWREDGKVFLDFGTGKILDADQEEEGIQAIVSLAGSISKLGEIKKSLVGIADSISNGFIKGGIPEFLGTPGKAPGVDYRRAWALMQAYGPSPRNSELVNKSSAIEKEFNKPKNWANRWYKKMRGWNELGVLDEWLDNYEAINAKIEEIGQPYTRTYKRSVPLNNILYASRGYFAYPAGVKVELSNEFVKFPSPLSVGFDRLEQMKENASELEDYIVERIPYDGRPLADVQTQPRSRRK